MLKPLTALESNSDGSGDASYKYNLDQILVSLQCYHEYKEILRRHFGDLFLERDYYFLLHTSCIRYWHNDPLTIKESRKVMEKDGPTATARIKKAIDAGFLQYGLHPDDGRKKTLIPTDNLERMVRLSAEEGINSLRVTVDRISHNGPMPPLEVGKG